jgi:hypothetical protein
MSYSVEVRVSTYASGPIPHSFLAISDGNGNDKIVGFAPEVTGLTGVGQVQDNTKHAYDASSGQIPLSEEQYNKLLSYVTDSAANPPYYNLPAGEQCTVWAIQGLVKAGIIPPYIGPYPDNGDLTSALLTHFFGFPQTLMFNPYVQKIGFEVNDLWHAFKNWVAPRRDPLVLDLDGDGIETLGITSTTQVLFDYDGDGVKTGTGWIKGDDGFVVLDRNGNGTIDNGGELFGDQTLVGGAKASDGFAALSAEDTNKNGKFDAGDTNFTKVRIWQDTNSDGISQAGELHTLSELGVTSINLTSTTSNNQNLKYTRRVA